MTGRPATGVVPRRVRVVLPRRLRAVLPCRARVAALDMRGHGRSTRDSRPFSYELPVGRFPRVWQVWDRCGTRYVLTLLAELCALRTQCQRGIRASWP